MPKFSVTHTVYRAESLMVVVEAEDENSAKDEAYNLLDQVPFACYEPGELMSRESMDVEPAPDSVFVTTIDELLQ